MTVKSVFFPDIGIREIHLLPGLVSPRLDHLMWIEDTNPDNNVRADQAPAGVDVSFQALFIGAPSAFGITLDEATGEVTVSAPLPAGPRLRSFMVLCGATEGTNVFVQRIRVNIHESMTGMWLSPFSVPTSTGNLTVRHGARGMRFSVMAQFFDEVVGDITNWSPFDPPDAGDRTFVRAAGSDTPVMAWSSSHPDVIGVHPATGLLDGKDAAANGTVTVRWPPAPAPATKTASGNVKGAPAWDAGVPLTYIQGPGFPRINDPDVHNILFLPDGFADTAEDQDSFRRYVRGVVASLTYQPRTRPFDLFAGQFNYFMAWVPSPDPGISVLNELDRGAGDTAVPIGRPTPPRVPPQPQWELTEIVNQVGLPTPRFDPPGSPLGTEAAGRLHDWRELYGEDITAAVVTPNYQDWLDLDDRVLLNERDTAFHIAMSKRPAIDGSATARELALNPLRMSEDDLNAFLGALKDDQNHDVPVWVSGGKDHDLVVILSRTNRSSGANTPRAGGGHYLAVSLNDDLVHHVTPNAAGNGFDIAPDPVPATVPADTWTTVAHELAHSWGLEDEYGGGGLIDVNSAADLTGAANAQPRGDLLVAGNLQTRDAANPDPSKRDLLKWRWPRIEKAGVLAAVVDDTSGTGAGPFRLQLKKNHGYPFGRGDVLRLRTRPLLAPGVTVSDRLKISRMLADGDLLEAVLLPGSALNPAAFPVGSVVMAPHRAADPDPAHDSYGDDLGLVHKDIRDRIDLTHNPLNAADGAGPNRPCPGNAATPTAATNFPGGAAKKPPGYSSWIVGLYENAKTFDCDVYRPTGICIMRRELYTDAPTGRQRAYQFCPVCRYAMVDLIDPSKHGRIDRDYQPRYPK